jgi:multiple sugar transport system permease protein
MIPTSFYEAASLDGAHEWHMFRTVTLPLLRPVLALVLVITMIGSFQVFDTVAVATSGFGGQPGGPANASRVLYLYIFQQAFEFYNLGYAAALSVALVGILLIVALVQLRLLRAGESDLS